MWPWEHAAIGYVVVSVGLHLWHDRSPSETEAVAVVVGSVIPDVIDKPLAWEFGVFSSGHGIGHSVFFAMPVSAAIVAYAATRDRLSVGMALATGYLLHLPMDVLPHYVRDGRLPVERVLWPVAETESSYPGGFGGTLREYFTSSAAALVSGPPSGYTLAVGVGLACTVTLWVYDGVPGLRWPVRVLAGAAGSIRRLR